MVHIVEWVIMGYPRCVVAEDALTFSAWMGPRWPQTAAAAREAALVSDTSLLTISSAYTMHFFRALIVPEVLS